MPDNATDQEPSIEEILASIRQIISDDDTGTKPAAAEAPQPVHDDVLELTEVIEEPPPAPPQPAPRMEIDMREAEPEPAPPPPPPPPPPPVAKPVQAEPPKSDDSLLTRRAATAGLEGFARLTSQMALDRSGTGGTTIEDIVRDLLKPMLREWLDGNLPGLIEKLVQKELDRLSRGS